MPNGMSYRWYRLAVARAIAIVLFLVAGAAKPAAAEQFALTLETVGGGVIYVNPGNHVVSGQEELFFEEGSEIALRAEPPYQTEEPPEEEEPEAEPQSEPSCRQLQEGGGGGRRSRGGRRNLRPNVAVFPLGR